VYTRASLSSSPRQSCTSAMQSPTLTLTLSWRQRGGRIFSSDPRGVRCKLSQPKNSVPYPLRKLRSVSPFPLHSLALPCIQSDLQSSRMFTRIKRRRKAISERHRSSKLAHSHWSKKSRITGEASLVFIGLVFSQHRQDFTFGCIKRFVWGDGPER